MSEDKKVLIVDDDLNMHEFYSELFADHDVTYCTSGEDALVVLQKNETKYDLIYLDLELLGMSGFATFAAIKSLGIALPPVVVSSSLTDSETQKTVKEMGAAAFVPKPINLQFAISVAHKLLHGQAPPTAQ
jgi:DNA-binding response OmpR family regulator